MPFAAAVSENTRLELAIRETADSINSALGQQPDLTFVFVTHHFSHHYSELAERLSEQLPSKLILGCTGEAVISGHQEFEDRPAFALWSGVLPGADLVPFQLDFAETPDGYMCGGLPDELGIRAAETRAVLLLGEPYSSVPHSMLELLADELPDVPVIGGMASGGSMGENRLFMNQREIEQGAIGVAIRGGSPIRSVVSQGCRPIGAPFVITRAERNVVYELGGASPMQRLQEIYQVLSPRDQKLVEGGGVHIGIALNAYQDTFHRGDFLILSVMGVDKKSGALKAEGMVRVGQTVQFQVRDAATADEDLKRLLDRHTSSHPQAAAALLFSCNGRGTQMFPAPHHDAELLQNQVGPIPLAGIFANGELGPVGGKNYIHGFTASIALFEDP